MPGIIDAVNLILSRSERQVELAGQNAANVQTPAYKRLVSFEGVMKATAGEKPGRGQADVHADFSPGKLMDTGRSYDLAIAGDGFFVVGGGDAPRYTRLGRFDLEQDGRLVTSQGLALQVEGGGDLILKTGDLKVASDGAVSEDGVPVAKLAIASLDPGSATPVGDGAYSAGPGGVGTMENPTVLQGKLEGSNVSMGAEMVQVMAALRQAETGQRLATVYDDLMGRVLQTLGQVA